MPDGSTHKGMTRTAFYYTAGRWHPMDSIVVPLPDCDDFEKDLEAAGFCSEPVMCIPDGTFNHDPNLLHCRVYRVKYNAVELASGFEFFMLINGLGPSY